MVRFSTTVENMGVIYNHKMETFLTPNLLFSPATRKQPIRVYSYIIICNIISLSSKKRENPRHGSRNTGICKVIFSTWTSESEMEPHEESTDTPSQWICKVKTLLRSMQMSSFHTNKDTLWNFFLPPQKIWGRYSAALFCLLWLSQNCLGQTGKRFRNKQYHPPHSVLGPHIRQGCDGSEPWKMHPITRR